MNDGWTDRLVGEGFLDIIGVGIWDGRARGMINNGFSGGVSSTETV